MATRRSGSAVLLGETVRRLRRRAALSQEMAAVLAGVSRNHIGEIERGETEASFEVVARIVSGFGISWADFASSFEDASEEPGRGAERRSQGPRRSSRSVRRSR